MANTDTTVGSWGERTRWDKWYKDSSVTDDEYNSSAFRPRLTKISSLTFVSRIYAEALQSCIKVNKNLNLGILKGKQGVLPSVIPGSSPHSPIKTEFLDGETVRRFVDGQNEKVKKRFDTRPDWQKAVKDFSFEVGKLITKLLPIVDIFMPQTPQYTIPYACLKLIFMVGFQTYIANCSA